VQAHILDSIQTQAAMEAAPRIIEPIQQTVTAVLRQHLNNPALQRSHVRQAIRTLGQPMVKVALKRLQAAYQTYQANGDIMGLLESVFPDSSTPLDISEQNQGKTTRVLSINDLHLICWEYIWS
jgi:hypothetical protein